MLNKINYFLHLFNAKKEFLHMNMGDEKDFIFFRETKNNNYPKYYDLLFRIEVKNSIIYEINLDKHKGKIFYNVK